MIARTHPQAAIIAQHAARLTSPPSNRPPPVPLLLHSLPSPTGPPVPPNTSNTPTPATRHKRGVTVGYALHPLITYHTRVASHVWVRPAAASAYESSYKPLSMRGLPACPAPTIAHTHPLVNDHQHMCPAYLLISCIVARCTYTSRVQEVSVQECAGTPQPPRLQERGVRLQVQPATCAATNKATARRTRRHHTAQQHLQAANPTANWHACRVHCPTEHAVCQKWRGGASTQGIPTGQHRPLRLPVCITQPGPPNHTLRLPP